MITSLVVAVREPLAGGAAIGGAGAYERISGRAYGEVQPERALNAGIVHLADAPRNARGNVEYSTDFFVLKPREWSGGNRKLLFEAPNRGGKRVLSTLNDAPPCEDPKTLAHLGNRFLMRQGYAVAWCGWQGDLLSAGSVLALNAPVAQVDGETRIRMVRAEIVVTEPGVRTAPLSGSPLVESYECAEPSGRSASLTVRARSYGPRLRVPTHLWSFGSDARSLSIPGGFEPNLVYELIYPARDPRVLGLGFAAVRDFVSHLRDGGGRDLGIPSLEAAYGWGRSQSARFLRDFVYHGFNEAESSGMVFDAIFAFAAGGGRTFLNYEFARPATSSRQHTDQLEPELFPFGYGRLRDPQTGRLDGILKRPRTDPRVVHVHTATEYWQKRGALAHTDGKGRDARLHAKVRVYHIAGAPHQAAAPAGGPRPQDCRHPLNNMSVSPALRALLVAMDRWVCEGKRPPESRLPTTRAGTLSAPTRTATGFPVIPGAPFSGLHNRQRFLDYGPRIGEGFIDAHPPKPLRGGYAILVPTVDADGNELAGIRLPCVSQPLGTYLGWNTLKGGATEGELADLLGSFLPFAATEAQRRANRDPRLSIAERYQSRDAYLAAVAADARSLVRDGLLLPEDVELVLGTARSSFDALLRGGG